MIKKLGGKVREVDGTSSFTESVLGVSVDSDTGVSIEVDPLTVPSPLYYLDISCPTGSNLIIVSKPTLICVNLINIPAPYLLGESFL